MNRYPAMFSALANRAEGAFVPFLVLGDPDPDTSLALLRTRASSGADALELGLPFSDAVADGPVIQAAATRALDQQIEVLERIWSAIKHDQRFYKNGVDRLLYRLADEVVGSYMPVVEALDKAIDDAEDQVFSNPTSRTLEKIFSLKRDVLHLRRVIGPQREVLNRLARDDYAVVEVRTRVYFRDVYDHLVRMHDITETVRDLVSGALDTYLSVINNRMNDIMKTLTVITTLFMPISFLTGFFGMNFFVAVPPYSFFTTEPVLVAVLLMVLLVPLAMFIWIRRRGWM